MDELKDEQKNESAENPAAGSDCEKQRDEYLDGWKRAKADLINYKKDESKRFESIIKFANEAIVKDLINVLDSFDLAIASFDSESDSKTQKGMYLIRRQLEDIMKLSGLESVIVSVGQPFDPGLQEAVGKIESDKPSGTVAEEVERGYMLHGKLIRAARVKIAK